MTTSARVRRWTVLAAAGALLATGCSSSADDSPEPRTAGTGATPTPDARVSDEPSTDEPGPRATPVSPPPEVVTATGDAVDDYADAVGDVLADPPPGDDSGDSDVALVVLDAVTGAALEELRNQAAEYEASGWRVVGRPRVVRHRVAAYYTDPERAVVRACLDNSKVRVVDADGRTVPGSRPVHPRTLNVLTVVKDADGDWVVTAQRPAARPNC